MAVEIDFGDLADGLEFDVDLFPLPLGRRDKGLAIPGAAAPLVGFTAKAGQREVIERIDIVVRVRRGNRRPIPVVEDGILGVSRAGFDEFPARIKIQYLPVVSSGIEKNESIND